MLVYLQIFLHLIKTNNQARKNTVNCIVRISKLENFTKILNINTSTKQEIEASNEVDMK